MVFCFDWLSLTKVIDVVALLAVLLVHVQCALLRIKNFPRRILIGQRSVILLVYVLSDSPQIERLERVCKYVQQIQA